VSATVLLDRLELVLETGPNRWMARCPAHSDRLPSLSIRELVGGRVLLHDFGGCEVGEILAALGLSISDLFENAIGQQLARSSSRIPAGDVLAAIDHEVHVVAVIAADLLEHRAIDQPTCERLAAAVAKIGAARVAAAPLRIRP
jgi:hypothetical protein